MWQVKTGSWLKLLLDSRLVDLTQPVTLIVQDSATEAHGGASLTVDVHAKLSTLTRTLLERGDPSFMFDAEIVLSWSGSKWTLECPDSEAADGPMRKERKRRTSVELKEALEVAEEDGAGAEEATAPLKERKRRTSVELKEALEAAEEDGAGAEEAKADEEDESDDSSDEEDETAKKHRRVRCCAALHRMIEWFVCRLAGCLSKATQQCSPSSYTRSEPQKTGSLWTCWVLILDCSLWCLGHTPDARLSKSVRRCLEKSVQ